MTTFYTWAETRKSHPAPQRIWGHIGEFMDNRCLTLEDVKEVKKEMIENYKEWLEKGILSHEEFESNLAILNSVESRLLFKSKIPKDAA